MGWVLWKAYGGLRGRYSGSWIETSSWSGTPPATYQTRTAVFDPYQLIRACFFVNERRMAEGISAASKCEAPSDVTNSGSIMGITGIIAGTDATVTNNAGAITGSQYGIRASNGFGCAGHRSRRE
jgi:hypothetical protein